MSQKYRKLLTTRSICITGLNDALLSVDLIHRVILPVGTDNCKI